MADRPNNLDLRRSIAQAVATAAARYRRRLRALSQTPGYAPGSSGRLGYPEACRAGFTFSRALRKVAREIDRRYLAGMRALGAEPSRPLSPDDARYWAECRLTVQCQREWKALHDAVEGCGNPNGM